MVSRIRIPRNPAGGQETNATDTNAIGRADEDRQRSPFTGWTRAHWEAVADDLLEAVRPHATPHQALVHLPGGRASFSGRLSDGLEGYARTFLLAAFRLAGANGAAPGDLAARYADGLSAGCSEGEEAWPSITDLSQPMVEAASIALGLYETRPWIWEQLPDGVRARAVDWLSSVHGKEYWPNNWLLFRVMVNAFLKSVNAPHRQDELERDLDRIDSMYRRDGWYTDGPGHNYDHYIGWAMHLYTILWCRMDGDHSDPSRAAVYRKRLRRFLEDYRWLFGANGAPLYHGRSLIYRFAATAPLWAGALAGATPLAPGETRRLASGALRHFLEHGALRDGVLTMGWHAEFLPMAQMYSGPASPYWASKAFLGLLLPAEHQVWTSSEEPMPVEKQDFCRTMPEPGFLAYGTRSDGIVRVASHRSDHVPFPGVRNDPNYGKLAYSTHTGPEIDPDGNALQVDSHCALIDGRGSASPRRRFHRIAVADRFAASVCYPGETRVLGEQSFPDWTERVETVSIAHAGMEIRLHHVTTPWSRTARDGGFAVADVEPVATDTGPGWALARRRDGLTSYVAALHGFDVANVHGNEETNAFGPYSATPCIETSRAAGGEYVHVSLVVLTGEHLDPDALRTCVDSVEVCGRTVTIRCGDGEQFFVQFVAPETVNCDLGRKRLRGPVRYARLSAGGDLFVIRDPTVQVERN
jgi:hypothetical protein